MLSTVSKWLIWAGIIVGLGQISTDHAVAQNQTCVNQCTPIANPKDRATCFQLCVRKEGKPSASAQKPAPNNSTTSPVTPASERGKD